MRKIQNGEFALSIMVNEIEAFLCFCILGENSKIQNGRHFRTEERFLKIRQSVLLTNPAVKKFR